MAKTLQTGTEVKVKTTAGRIRHAIVKTVTSQDAITVSIGKATAISATRGSSTTTRGTIFSEV